MADDPKRPQNNTIEFLNKLTRLFQSGPRVRHKIPKRVTGKRNAEVSGHLQGGQYFGMRDPYIYNAADRYYRYEDFAMMEFTPEIASALDVYASSVAGMDENRRTIIVKSGNKRIKDILYSLFSDIMNFDVNLYPWARNLVKYGDFFLFLKLDPNHGVIGTEQIPIDMIEREEKVDPQTRQSEVNFRVSMEGMSILKPHQIGHFRLPFNDQFYPYGTSILDPARKIWRSMCLPASTLVWTSEGHRRISDIEPGDDIFSFEDGNLIATKVKNVLNSGEKDAWTIKTRNQTITASPDHKFLVSSGEYRKTSELRVGQDKLVFPVQSWGVDCTSVCLDPDHYFSVEKPLRLPGELFGCTLATRRTFISRLVGLQGQGLWPTKTGNALEFCNYELLQDVQTLCARSGIECGDIETYEESHRMYINMNEDTWNDEVHDHLVTGIEVGGKEDMWDIEVDHEAHNFIAGGIVTHNSLLEDAVMVYRIVRSPERRVFKIDVGNIPPEDVEAFMERVETNMRRQIVADDSTGRLDLRYSALDLETDYWLPLRNGQGSEIETLPGGTWADGLSDVEYLQAKLFSALKVPKPYLNFMDSSDASKTALTEMNIIFAEHVRRIQNAILDELYKISMIHLMFHGYSESELLDFELELASSSMLAQQQAMETYRQKFEILASAPEDIPRRLLYKKIMGWDDDDIEEMTADKIKEAQLMGILGKLNDGDFAGAAEGFASFGDDVGGDFDLGGDDLGGDDFGDDLGGGDEGGIEPMGGSGGAESEVEDLFAGPFDPEGKSIFHTPDDVDDYARRKAQADDVLRKAITTAPMDFLIPDEPEDDEEVKRDRHGRRYGEPTARKTQDRERAPGAGRPREPGSSVRIRGKDKDGSGRRHISTKTGVGDPVTRYTNDLMRPSKNGTRNRFRGRVGLNKEYRSALDSLSDMLGNTLNEQADPADIDFSDLEDALSVVDQTEEEPQGEKPEGAGVPPKESMTPAEHRQAIALRDQDAGVKNALAALAAKDEEEETSDSDEEESDQQQPATRTVSQTSVVLGEGEEEED